MTVCYDVPCPFWTRCIWCGARAFCADDYRELADRDSDWCRYIQYHMVKRLDCEMEPGRIGCFGMVHGKKEE